MPDFSLEQRYDGRIAGFDEVGCGPWAGPVVAAGMIFYTQDLPHNLAERIQDSKKLSHKQRQEIFQLLQQGQGKLWDFAVGVCSVPEVDTLNIRNAALCAMKRAYEGLLHPPTAALVDGISKPDLPVSVMTVKKGDQLSLSIAAASILAKVTRDDLMCSLAKDYPAYGWEKNAGYGTRHHQEALARYGVTPHHRRSFAPIAALLAKEAA